MAHFVGLDVSVKKTSVCVVDAADRVILEQKVPTEPADIIALLTSLGVGFCRIGIEAGPLSQWLVNALTVADLPVICVETRHMKALLTAQQINKTDRNDARGIAQMMRVGLFKPVHVKTLVAQEQRMLLTSRKLLQRKLLDLELELRGTLRNFGLKVGIVSGSRYEARVRELVTAFPRLAAIAEPLLNVRRVMRQQLAVLHKMLLDTVRDDPVCRRLMTAPGVGAVVALTYRATVDQPQRFIHSRAVGAHVGLTPKRYQSGETDYDGGVSKCGDALLRTMLYEAAHSLLIHGRKWSWLKAWGIRVAQRRGCVEPLLRSPVVWRWFCTGCGLTVASFAGASTASRFLRLLETGGGEIAGKELSVLLRQKHVLTGTTGGGEFVRSADPAADQRQGRP